MKRYLGNISSLKQDLQEVEEALEFAEGSAKDELLQTKAEIEAEIAELQQGEEAPAPKKQSTRSTPKKKAQANDDDTCDPIEFKKMKAELSRLRLKRGGAGKSNSQKSGESKSQSQKSGESKSTKRTKTATYSPRSYANRLATESARKAPRKGSWKVSKPKTVEPKITEPKTKRTTTKGPKEPSPAQQAKKVQQQAKIEAQAVQRSAQANSVTQKVGKDYMSYLFITDAIKKYNAKIGKEAGHGWHYSLYNAILQGNRLKRFTSNSPSFGAMNAIFKALENQLNVSSFSTGAKAIVGKDLSNDQKKMIADIVEADKDFLTAHYAKQFIAITKSKNTKSADALIKRIETAKKTKGITADMPFYKEMEEARKKAEARDFTVSNALEGIHKKTRNLRGFLNGLGSLGSIGCTCQMNEKKK